MFRVLVPVDDSMGRAVAQAEVVRRLHDVVTNLTVDVLHVQEARSAPDSEWVAGGFADEYVEEMRKTLRETHVPESVGSVVESFESAGIDFTVSLTAGDPTTTILDIAAERDSDLIVIAARGRSPVGKVFFGSVAQGVLLDSDRPVTVVTGEDQTSVDE